MKDAHHKREIFILVGGNPEIFILVGGNPVPNTLEARNCQVEIIINKNRLFFFLAKFHQILT